MNVVLSTSPFYSDFKFLFSIMNLKYDLNINTSIATGYKDILNADVVLFTGGEDISPEIYGEKNISSANNPHRDYIDSLFFNTARDLEKKILGVCRGHQLINALMGGKLIQDIKDRHPGKHELVFSPEFKYNFPFVNSLHHQGVITLGEEMISYATYKNVHEITKSKDHKILSVQFHPEFMHNCPAGILEMIKDFMYD